MKSTSTKQSSLSLTYGHYMNDNLPQYEKVIAEYVWIDGTGINVRSKCRTLSTKVTEISELPEWNYDGSSTHQATTEESEVILKPVAFYPDPFRGGDNILVMCSTYRLLGKNFDNRVPTLTNFRHHVEDILGEVAGEEAWFGVEQEYTLYSKINNFTQSPLGWPVGGYPTKEGPYYCGVGTGVSHCRAVMDLHYEMCLAAKINISGNNSESMPGTGEFQIGPSDGITVGDQLWMARYILWRITEDMGLGLSFHPKVEKNWSGAALHTNFSTNKMRLEGGYEHVKEAVEKLEKAHKLHISLYGEDNEKRLKGDKKISPINTFSSGVGDRTVSVRIPTSTVNDDAGYFEDRRPGSNADPYVIAGAMCSTILLEGEGLEALQKHYDTWIQDKASW
jgi:glutamine synthetase